MKKVILLLFASFWCFSVTAFGAPVTNANEDLIAVQNALQKSFKTFSYNLEMVTKKMSRYGVAGSKVKAILKRHYLSNSNLLVVSTLDTNGRLAAAYSTRYQTVLGEELYFQPDVKKLLTTHNPVLSRILHTVQGPKAIILYQPVFSPQNEFVGAVCDLVAPDYLMREAVATLKKSSAVEIWALQTNGYFIYNSAHPEMIDQPLVGEKLYHDVPEFRELNAKILRDRSGGYKFMSEKAAAWTTIKLHDTEWRIVVIE